MNLAILIPSTPRKEWLLQGEDVWMAGVAAVGTALLLLLLTRVLRKKEAKGSPYRKWLVLLACGIAMIVLPDY